MRRAKRFLGLFLACAMSLSYLPVKVVSADSGVSDLEVSVVGNGEVVLDDYENKYPLESGDTFKAKVTSDTELTITVNAKEGSSIEGVTLEGSPLPSVTDGMKSATFDYKVPHEGGKVVVSFKEDKVETTVETPPVIEEKPVETPQESSKEETKDEIVEQPKEDEVVESKPVTKDTIIDEYLQGVYDSKSSLEFRKNLVEKYSLQEYVDEDFFFKIEYLDKIIDLNTLGDIITLVKISKTDLSLQFLQSGEIDPLLLSMMEYDEEKITFNSSLGSERALTVTNHGSIVYYEGGIMMGYTDIFSVGGRTAFCMDRSKKSPHTGVAISGVSVISDSNIRKILYYGFEGPGQVSGWDSNGLRIATAFAISEVRHGDGFNIGKRLLNQVRNLPEPPSSFTAYMADTVGNQFQDLAYWMYSPKGSLQISKESANPSVTNGNNYYSLTGAQYGVFKNSNATGQVATLTIGSNSWSQEVTLDAGTYYIKELKAPKGYALDTKVYSIKVTSGTKATATYKDRPQLDPIAVALRKVDADTGLDKPQGGGSLGDAHFTFKFYAGEYADGVNPADLGKSPTRTWVMKTGSNGVALFNDAHKVSGDAFWYTSFGAPALPLGTLTIQESKAPTGYKLNPEVFVRRITPNGTSEGVSTYNEPTIKEDSLNFTIRKVQAGTTITLPNIEFKHTKPDGSSEILKTGNNGEITMRGITPGIHKIQETKTTDGFEVNPNEFVFEVTADNTIKVISNTTNMGMSYSESNGDGMLIVENELSPFKLKVVKVNDKNKFLEGAEFTLYEDRDCTKEVGKAVSNANGELMFENLKVGKSYYFKETKAPAGYRIPVDANGKVHVYEVITESRPANGEFIFTIDGIRYTNDNTTGDIHLEGNKADRVISIKVVNAITMKLPATGSNMMIPLMLVGTLMMSLSIVYSKKKRSN